jgi:hypothetical protein
MTTTTLRHLSDAYADQTHATENNGDNAKLVISNASSNVKRAFLFAGGGPRPGAYVLSATLHLFARGTWSGSQTLTAQRVVERWKERTLTWRRQPTTTATNEGTVSIGAQAAGDEVTIDVTDMIRQAYLGSGVDYFGIRVTASGSGSYPIHSHEASDPDLRPFLEIDYTHNPTQAYDLVPGDGQAVSVGSWVQRWTYYDAADNEQATAWVQIDTDDTFATPTFDSGWVSTTDPELDLAATAYGGLADGATVFVRVKVRNTSGQEGDWSDAVEITRSAKGTLTINAPASLTVDSTPEIITTLSGRDQVAISYELRIVEGAVGNAVPEIWRKPRFSAPADDGETFSFEIPRQVIRLKGTDFLYRLTVRSWDDVDERVATAGDPTYVESVVEFSWVDASSTPTPPSSITVSTTSGPGVKLSWVRAAVPDYWAIVVDGVLLLDKVPATDYQVDSTHYELTLYSLEPGTAHDLEVVALETE